MYYEINYKPANKYIIIAYPLTIGCFRGGSYTDCRKILNNCGKYMKKCIKAFIYEPYRS